MKHENNGACERCQQIINRYANFHPQLRAWFEAFQKKVPTAHASCAGRGELDQEECLRRGASKAHWTKSAHNWNCALDIFELGGKSTTDLYEYDWYKLNLAPNLIPEIDWYGAPGAKFPELPHVEWRGWRELAASGGLSLVV
jgi:hypothetical protein